MRESGTKKKNEPREGEIRSFLDCGVFVFGGGVTSVVKFMLLPSTFTPLPPPLTIYFPGTHAPAASSLDFIRHTSIPLHPL